MAILEYIARNAPMHVPLCLDALSARIAEKAGFGIGYVSGGALGYAHAVSEALLSVDELCDVVRHVTARCSLPIIVDGGVGFGDAVHLTRAVSAFIAAGASAIEIEDQVAPKRVSHHRGVEHLVSLDEMVSKVSYAARARGDADCALIARTGAVRNESLDAAIERANAYAGAGADMILAMASSDDDYRRLCGEIAAPIVTFGALGSRDASAWRDLGVSLVIDPFTPQVLAVKSLEDAYRSFFETGTTGHAPKDVFDVYGRLDTLAGFDELYAIEDATTERP